ncbi:hypothetical protein [Chryseobacterium sp.]|uniref:hypothetical protein n=1 Tax=Chryseobacterium sp. TaxID=1871047 RepID=UPI002FC67B60
MPVHYYNICIRVTIAEKYVFQNVESIEINNSLDTLSDTAKITIPRVFLQKINQSKSHNRVNLISVINLEDKIKIEAGYNEEYNTEFEGYISAIKDDMPVTIECEDEMYKLKKAERIKAHFKNADVKDILRKIAPNYKVETFKEFKIGKFSINNETPYEVLMNLKQNSIRTYFKDGVLHAGLPINLQGFKVHQFNMNRNVRKGNNLVYEKKKNDYYLKVTSDEIGTSKPISFEIGKKGNNNKEIQLPAGMSKEDLKTYATDFYNGVVNTKCRGSFDSWGLPRTSAGDTADITTPNFPDSSRNGKYIIESVKISVSASDGFKRTNTLGVMLYK